MFHETNLNDCGKVLSIDVILCLQVQVTQLTGSYWVVLGVELIETLEGLSTLQRKIQDDNLDQRDYKTEQATRHIWF